MNRLVRIGLLLLVSAGALRAFPPAPHHVIYGTVRDDHGHPLAAGQAEVILETSSGVTLRATTLEGAEPGVNFALVIPMDAGITDDTYRPTALRPTVPFRLRVRIGQASYVPFQMRGDFHTLGRPGARTRIDLTLGEDTDGDGLPDAWERALAQAAGRGQEIRGITPDGDLDGDGLSNLAEYLAGTYAYDPTEGFALKLLRVDAEGATAEFLAVAGRSYVIEASADLKAWTAADFQVGQGSVTKRFQADDTRVERVRIVIPEETATPMAFYRVIAR
jgi:hypothetical protein